MVEEEEEGSSELYEGKVVLQVAPGVVLLQVRALKGDRREGGGVGNTKKGENKTGDGIAIAFLFRDRSGGGGAAARSVLPDSDNVPAGEMGRDHKNRRASLFATDVYIAVL